MAQSDEDMGMTRRMTNWDEAEHLEACLRITGSFKKSASAQPPQSTVHTMYKDCGGGHFKHIGLSEANERLLDKREAEMWATAGSLFARIEHRSAISNLFMVVTLPVAVDDDAAIEVARVCHAVVQRLCARPATCRVCGMETDVTGTLRERATLRFLWTDVCVTTDSARGAWAAQWAALRVHGGWRAPQLAELAWTTDVVRPQPLFDDRYVRHATGGYPRWSALPVAFTFASAALLPDETPGTFLAPIAVLRGDALDLAPAWLVERDPTGGNNHVYDTDVIATAKAVLTLRPPRALQLVETLLVSATPEWPFKKEKLVAPPFVTRGMTHVTSIGVRKCVIGLWKEAQNIFAKQTANQTSGVREKFQDIRVVADAIYLERRPHLHCLVYGPPPPNSRNCAPLAYMKLTMRAEVRKAADVSNVLKAHVTCLDGNGEYVEAIINKATCRASFENVWSTDAARAASAVATAAAATAPAAAVVAAATAAAAFSPSAAASEPADEAEVPPKRVKVGDEVQSIRDGARSRVVKAQLHSFELYSEQQNRRTTVSYAESKFDGKRFQIKQQRYELVDGGA
jgi:hypothetical protein